MNGILVINKPKGITSFDAIRKVSKVLNIKKIGHTGTLDPIASGVLVLTIGNYTKLSELLVSSDKEYIATGKLNVTSESLDTESDIIKTNNVHITKDNLEDALKTFQKTYLQEVPKYSAVKVNGKKLYEYARNNEEVVLPKKEVSIKKIELLDYQDDTFKFKCLVSKGTYIRSLIRDIGEFLNTTAIMTDLIRTKQGKFLIDDAYSIEDIENGNYKILTIEDVLDLPVIEVNQNEAFKIKNGVKLVNTYNVENKVIFKYNNDVLAIYKREKELLKVDKMLYKN